MYSAEVQYKMGTIFMNSENSKRSEPQRLLLNLADEINLKRSDKYVALSNLSMYYTQKIIINTKTIKLECQLQHGVKNLIYLMDRILNQIFKTLLYIS